LAAFFYTVCSALRLARFNSQSHNDDKRYFQGLAVPAAAGVVAGAIWVCSEFHISGPDYALIVTIVTIILGLLKVSTIRYRSFKDLDIRGKVPFMVILIIVLLIVLISFDPPIVLLVIFSSYVLSGPLGTLWALRKTKQKRLKQRKRRGH
jgi:CDP-diacylglycerol--serine O-phosphatidyltransferase